VRRNRVTTLIHRCGAAVPRSCRYYSASSDSRGIPRGAPCESRKNTSKPIAFEVSSKRRKGFPSETHVKRGDRVVGGSKELIEKLGRNDLCPCGSGRRFQALLLVERRDGWVRQESLLKVVGRPGTASQSKRKPTSSVEWLHRMRALEVDAPEASRARAPDSPVLGEGGKPEKPDPRRTRQTSSATGAQRLPWPTR
jgi:hypothetical protein